MVLTECYLKIILFPFQTAASYDMVTAVTLEPLPIWEEGSFGVVSKTLKLAAMLSMHRPTNHVTYPGDPKGQLKRQLAGKVISEKNKQVAEAEHKRKKAEHERKKAEQRAEEAQEELQLEREQSRELRQQLRVLQEEWQSAKRTKMTTGQSS